MDWEALNSNTSIVPVANTPVTGSIWVVLPSVMRSRYTDPTLMASRLFALGNVQIGNTATDPLEVVHVGVGLIKWDSIDDQVPDPDDCPNPIFDNELDWIDRMIWPVPTYGYVASTISLSQPLDSVHLSKAKRRLGTDSSILLCYGVLGQNNSGGNVGNHHVQIASDVRCLIKE